MFGEGVTGLAVVRALGRMGVPQYVVSAQPALVASSRWYRPAPVPAPADTQDGERVADYLRRLPFDEAVTFAGSDDWALGLASLPDDVAGFRRTTATAEVLRTLVDKLPFARAAEGSGVPIPRTLPVDAPDDLDAVTTAELPDYFLKPRDSQAFNRRFGRKGIHLTDRASARAEVERLRAGGFELVLQEYLPGPATAHVFLDGYVDRGGRMRACLARRRLRMYPPRLGNSTLSETIALDDVAPAVIDLRRLFADLGFHGFFDAEFKHDPRDGRFKLLEVNARPWWQFELASASGLDVAGLAYADVLGREVQDAPPVPPGRRWVNPAPDLRAWHAAGFRRPTPVRAFFSGANAVYSRDDPGPLREEGARLARMAAGRRRGGG